MGIDQNNKTSGFVDPFVKKLFTKPTPRYEPGSTQSQLKYENEIDFHPDGTIIAGPIIHFRGSENRYYHLAIIILAAGPTAPRFIPTSILANHFPAKLLTKKTPSGLSTTLWRYDIVTKQKTTEYIQRYRFRSPYLHLNRDEGGEEESSGMEPSIEFLSEESSEVDENGDVISESQRGEDVYYKFIVPGIGTPLNICVNSCNKQHHNAIFTNLWVKMYRSHLQRGYHLSLHLGDQVYSDPELWTLHPSLNRFLKRFRKKKVKFTREIEQIVDDYFFSLYVRYWTIPEIARVLASIPNIMMWDDHDIFDGFGSYRSSWQNTEVFQGIFKVAQKYFCLFQLGCHFPHEHLMSTPRGTPGLSQVYHINDVLILSLDNRSERTRKLIMSAETYKAIEDYLYSINNRPINHVLLLIGIPIVYNSFNKIERIIAGLNFGFEDDMRDHWRSLRRKRERKYFFDLIQKFATFKKCRITVLSGDVHLGCAGAVESKEHKVGNASIINSLVTSGIGSLPPPKLLLFYLNFTKHFKDHISRRRGIKGGLHEFETGEVYIRYRNFMTLQFDESNGFEVEWITEGNQTDIYKVYINAYSESKRLDYSYGKRTRGRRKRKKVQKLVPQNEHVVPTQVTT